MLERLKMYVNCLIVAPKELNNLHNFHSLLALSCLYSNPFSFSLTLPGISHHHHHHHGGPQYSVLSAQPHLISRRHKRHFICINEFCKFWVALDAAKEITTGIRGIGGSGIWLGIPSCEGLSTNRNSMRRPNKLIWMASFRQDEAKVLESSWLDFRVQCIGACSSVLSI